MDIIPAILVKTSEELLDQIKKLSPHFNHFQIDIADGKFVPNETLTLDDVYKAIKNNAPLFKKITLDFDLMVEDYMSEIEKVDDLIPLVSIQNVFPHISAVTNYSQIASLYPEFTVGLAFDPEDRVETIIQQYDLENIPIIQIMSVDPGFQGKDFLEDVLIKIEQLRMDDYRSDIYLDGGVNSKSIPAILSKKFQPDALCIGSFLTKADNTQAQVEHLRNLLTG